MKRYLKKIVCLVIGISLFILFTNISFAYDYGQELKKEWINQGSPEIVEPTRNVIDNIVKIIRVVGTGVSIIMISYIGIKYMTGSPNEKADYKKSAIPFVTGAIILFAATNLVGIIYNFAETVTK